jgi:tubulin beta
MAVNLVPFPRLHFFTCAFAPFTARGSQQYMSPTVSDLMLQMFNRKSTLNSCDARRGIYMTASAQFRGRVSSMEVDKNMLDIQAMNTSFFTEWVPSNMTSSICAIPPRGLKLAATLIANTTALREVFTKIDAEFCFMYARRSYVHWYVDEGLEMVQFDESRSNMVDLIVDYEYYEQTTAEMSDDNELSNDTE